MSEATVVAEPSATPARRVRRPSGEPPPLPRKLEMIDRVWLAVGGVVVLTWIVVALTGEGLGADLAQLDRQLMEPLLSIRSSWLTSVARDVEDLASPWSLHVLRWGMFLALVVFRRFRHLFVLLLAMATVAFVADVLVWAFHRPRPYGVEVLGTWRGYSHPSVPIVAMTSTLCGICLTLVPRGRPRVIAASVGGVVLLLLATARVYLGTDHPSDVVFGVFLTVMLVVLIFRVLAPEQAFPVEYRRGKTAHLNLDGQRARAIHVAISQQLGFTVDRIRPVGLAGSAGSTPMRIYVAEDPPGNLFAKLYAQNHLRSDRWYKLGREILYGRLEDETSFRSVRQLVLYEDHVMRVMRDAGVPVAETWGIVELTPEREYLLVTEFLLGAKELGDPELEVTDEVIDSGLAAVRAMWDGGLAHRDIKPANLMVRDGKVTLIDVAFGEIRPSPWRQAVDLANMMLVLAIRTDAARVYQRALLQFTEADVAEAFAATRGVTSPTQLRGLLRARGGDLIAEFRSLAPPRPPIPIQRWSLRRLGLMTAVGIGGLLLVAYVVGNLLTIPT